MTEAMIKNPQFQIYSIDEEEESMRESMPTSQRNSWGDSKVMQQMPDGEAR